MLDAPYRRALERCFGPAALLAFDFDGTLAPIAPHPSGAHLRARTRDLLARVCRLYRVVIVTGRSRRDVSGFLNGLPLCEIIGNHGIDSMPVDASKIANDVRAWHATLDNVVREWPGAWIEEKGLSLSVHYRACAEPEKAGASITVAAERIPGVRVLGGKAVANLLPRESGDKGTALVTLREQLGRPPLLFVGDDQTDEDAFARLQGHDVITVRVGFEAGSAAGFFLHDQEETDVLLQALVDGAGSRLSAR